MEMCMLLQIDVLESMSTSSHYFFQMKWNAFIFKVHIAKKLMGIEVHSNLPNIMPMATKVHMILRRCVVLTQMHDNRSLV